MTLVRGSSGEGESLLTGCAVLITRPQSESHALAEAIRTLGGHPLVAPLIEVVYPDEQLTFDPPFNPLIDHFDAVAVTSANAVRGWFHSDAFVSLHQEVSSVRWYVVGERTRNALLHEAGIDGYVPEGCKTGHDLAAYLAGERVSQRIGGSRILYLRGTLASATFREVLAEAGWQVTECICYEVRSAPWPARAWQEFLETSSPRAILLFSPSAAQALVSHLAKMGAPPTWMQGTVIACVGTTTATACSELGLPVHAVASRPDRDALLSATVAALSRVGRRQNTGFEDNEEGTNHDRGL